MYKGGVGVKGDNSWDSWWDEEQMHIQTLRGMMLETVLNLRFFMFHYGIVYKIYLTGRNTSHVLHGFLWIVVLAAIVMLLKLFWYSPKKSSNMLAGTAPSTGTGSVNCNRSHWLGPCLDSLSVPDLFAGVLAFIPTR